MLLVHYKTKKELKASKGKQLLYTETSLFGPEYKSTGTFPVTNIKRNYFASVTTKNDIIVKVS